MFAFLGPVTTAVGANPAGIAVGDFNSDGRDDMAVVNSGLAGSVSVLLSNADGGFAAKVDYSAGANALDATAGDFNGDGKLDLAVVGSAVDILLGNGDGTFGAPLEFQALPSAHSIKSGDFNNDGLLDIGTMNVNSASVLLGNGDGSFQSRLDAPVAGNNINLVVDDFNRDGYLDMATSNTNSIGTINVLRGHGDGSFDNASSYYAFSAPVYLASGDFNHDGYPDFAVPNSYAATSMSIVLNNGDGTYGAPHTYGIAQTGYEIEVADFNNDGNDDYAVRGGSQYMISHGKGDGTFYPAVNFSTPSGRFEAGTHGDFNGDGAIDLAYPSSSGVTVVTNDHADYQNLAGAVTFRLSAPATTTSGSVLPMTISAIDANGEVATGFRGVVYISSSDPAASTAAGYAFNPLDAGIPYVFTAADGGSHSFTGAIRLVTGGEQTVTVSAPNLQAASTTVNVTGQVSKLTFTTSPSSVAGDTVLVTVSAFDTQGALAAGYSSKIHFTSTDTLAGLPADYTFTPEDGGEHTFEVTLKTAGAQFVSATEVGGTIRGGATVNVTPQVAQSLALAGGTGAIGIARSISIVARDAYGNAATGYTGTVHLTSSDAAAILPDDITLVNGRATANVTFLTVGAQTVTATDIQDASITGTVSSDATPPVPALFRVEGYPATTAGQSNAFSVTVRDTIGQVATGFVGTVYFSSSDMQAGLPASYTFTTADAGVHSFAATLKTAGMQSISVRDLSGLLAGTEAGIEVDSADFSSFRLSVPNGADSKGHMLVAAGDAISLTVKAVDAYGNLVSDYAGTVAISSTDTQAGVPANYTFAAADGGAHTFLVDLRTATPNSIVWSFDVVDLADATTLATLTNFEVVNAAAASFTVSMPSNAQAGVPFSAKVTALDLYGNTVKNYFGSVHLESSAANAALPADYEFNNLDAGVHDFLLSLNSSGSQTLRAIDLSDSLVQGVASSSVSAGLARGVAVSLPASGVAGAAQTITVKAVDAFGNVDETYRGTVAFSSSDVQAGLPASYRFASKDSGVHSFSVTLKTAGVQSVRVRDANDASMTVGEGSMLVTPSSAAGSFIVSGFPDSTAGEAQAFTVAVKDPFGNLTTSYTGTVTFSSSDTQALLPASYTFTAADGGKHAFMATLRTAGTQSITVRDAATSSAIGSQAGIRVTAPVVVGTSTAASFAVTGSTSTVAGQGKTFTVTALDSLGNVVVGYTGTVVFRSSDIQAGLPASYTFTAADKGIHTFSATLKTAGTQSITVLDAATASVLGSQIGISVTAAAASKFSFSLPATINQNSGFKFTVTARDAYGNVATGYRGKVQVRSADSKGGTISYTFTSKDNGVASLSYTFGNAGSQTLTITDTTNPAITSSITINVLSKK